jgi:hypothetical protein
MSLVAGGEFIGSITSICTSPCLQREQRLFRDVLRSELLDDNATVKHKNTIREEPELLIVG